MSRDSSFEKTTEIPATADELFRWHLRPGAFARLVPPWQTVEVVGPGEVREGSRVELRLKVGPLAVRWLAEHRNVEPGRGFEDVQVETEARPGGVAIVGVLRRRPVITAE